MREKKSYCILKKCFYAEPERSPYFEVGKNKFNSFENAQAAAEKMCREEADSFNRTKVEGGLHFSGGESGDERYDYWTLAWDGDDYRVVTGYIVIGIPSENERVKNNAS